MNYGFLGFNSHKKKIPKLTIGPRFTMLMATGTGAQAHGRPVPSFQTRDRFKILELIIFCLPSCITNLYIFSDSVWVPKWVRQWVTNEVSGLGCAAIPYLSLTCNMNWMLQAGRFTNPEEHPFFPDDLQPSLVPPYNYTQVMISTKTVAFLFKFEKWSIFVGPNSSYRFCIHQLLPLT